MSSVMTFQSYWDTLLDHGASLRESPLDGDHTYMAWVPVLWSGTPLDTPVEDCDDWKDFFFYHPGSLSEAAAEVRLIFGEAADVELLDD